MTKSKIADHFHDSEVVTREVYSCSLC